MLRLDTKLWLPDYILARLDKMTMANSIEAREPYLDHRLIELSARVPSSLKVGGSDKYVLREAMRNKLPEDVRRRPKRTFITPIHQWAEKGLLDLCSTLLSESVVKRRGYFKYPAIRRILERYFQSKLIVGRQLWTLLTLEIWYRVYIESEKVRMPSHNMIA
jgi:asparagine synthase (glutamine-hydrolysing)